jgi:hypothetical protein
MSTSFYFQASNAEEKMQWMQVCFAHGSSMNPGILALARINFSNDSVVHHRIAIHASNNNFTTGDFTSAATGSQASIRVHHAT